MKNTRPYRLLLADDSPTIRRLIKDILTPENFEVKAVEDGEQAIQEMRYFLPDVVLADTDMPKLNGYQLCEKIKKGADTMHIPVVLIVGVFEPIDEGYIRSIGANGFIAKPFEPNELIGRVKELIAAYSNELKLVNEEIEISEDAPVETISPLKEIRWDDDIPIADEKANNQMVDENYESEMYLEGKEINKLAKEAASLTKVDVSAILKDVIAEKMEGLMNRDDVLNCIYSAVKDSVGQMIANNAQNIIETVSKELISDLLRSVRSEIDASIKRIVSDTAERIIKKEIERIISETI